MAKNPESLPNGEHALEKSVAGKHLQKVSDCQLHGLELTVTQGIMLPACIDAFP